MSERNLLRKYRSTTFYDGGLFGDPGDRKLEIVDKNDKVLKEFYFKESDPAAVNKAIEKAKEWVNSNVKDDLPADPQSGRYTDDELAEFKEILDNKVDAAIKELQYLNEQLSTTTNEKEKEEFQKLSARQDSYILHLNAALGRIADKTYGICRVTGKLIGKDRLRAVPHATLSLEGKQLQDQGGVKTNEKSIAQSSENKPLKKEKGKKEKENSKQTEMHEGSSSEPVFDPKPERKCRVCGCTDDNCKQCIEKTGSACHWVEEDLCSACVPESEIKVTDERASHISEESQVESEPVIPENPTDFFTRLYNKSKSDVHLVINIIQVGDKLTVEFIPATKMKLKPIVATGTPQELDEGFFPYIQPAINEIKGLVTNVEEVKAEARAAKDNAEKPVRKSVQRSKSKPATKSSKAKPASQKKAPVIKKAPKKADKKSDQPSPVAVEVEAEVKAEPVVSEENPSTAD